MILGVKVRALAFVASGLLVSTPSYDVLCRFNSVPLGSFSAVKKQKTPHKPHRKHPVFFMILLRLTIYSKKRESVDLPKLTGTLVGARRESFVEKRGGGDSPVVVS